jgi:hypothetical protein
MSVPNLERRVRALETVVMPPRTVTLITWEGDPDRSDTLESACIRDGIPAGYENLKVIEINIMQPIGGD